MVSEKQHLANRRNALRSTGPKTPQGKAVSRGNAFRHGLQSDDVVVAGEDPEMFACLQNDLAAELDPAGFQEAEIVQRMAVLMWRLRRLYRIEAGILAYEQAVAERDLARSDQQRRQRAETYSALLGSFDTDPADHQTQEEAPDDLDLAEARVKHLSADIGVAFKRDAAGANALTKLSRYETAMERSLSRLRAELEQLRNSRKEEDDEPPVTIDHLDRADP
jgi:hypothetical protein